MQFFIGSNSTLRPSVHYEAVLRSLSEADIKKPLPKLGPADPQYQPKIARLLKALKEDSPKLLRTTLGYTEGQRSHFIFLSQKLTPFQLHTELRKALETDCLDLLEQAEFSEQKISFDVSKFSLPEEKRMLAALVYFLGTLNWKPKRTRHENKMEKKNAATRNSANLSIFWGGKISAPEFKQITEEYTSLAQANNQVRTLAELPANLLNPLIYRNEIKQIAKTSGLKFEFWDTEKLRQKKAGAFLAVTQADEKSEGGIVRVTYEPQAKTKSKPIKEVVLVGKGICFDTGGYNLKSGAHMRGMHMDMTGSALALSLCQHFARMRAPFRVSAYLALAENLISPTAYKPNEVVMAANGKSIEIVDTDAEGRMVLADTLALADLTKPSLIIDFATLTYASMRALDTRRAAVFSPDENLAQSAIKAGDESGERCWSFPLSEDYKEELKSQVADLLQCANSEHADHIYAATFLAQFVSEKTPWVHLDLSAANHKGGLGLISSDCTGFGVLWAKTFIEMATPNILRG